MAALRAGKSDTTSSAPSAPEIVKSSYTPIGRVDIAAIRAQAKDSQPTSEPTTSYVGTTGYAPVQLPKPKPLTSRYGGGAGSRSTGGTTAPMPVAPVRESKAIGGASRNFAADSSGKTPSQLWAERKAREGGSSGTYPSVTSSIASRAPQTSTSPRQTTHVEDSSEDSGTPVSGGVAAMKERLARQSIDDQDAPSLPISPSASRRSIGSRMTSASSPTTRSPPTVETEPSIPAPPPIVMSSKPPAARTFQSLDDVVAAGAGAGVGLGIAGLTRSHEDEEEEQEPEVERQPSPPPPPQPRRPTWGATSHVEEEGEEEDHTATQRSHVYAEQEHEPEPEPEPEPAHDVVETPTHHAETGAQHGKTAIVLFEYEAQEDNEISLEEGQIITNIEFIDDVFFFLKRRANSRDGGQVTIHLDEMDYSRLITLNCRNTKHRNYLPSHILLPHMPLSRITTKRKKNDPTGPMKENPRSRNTTTKLKKKMN